MPAEVSGRDEFDFEYGSDFAAHIEEFDPAFTKVLVRHNPEGDRGLNERQTLRLRRLADWLHEHGRKLLFEACAPMGLSLIPPAPCVPTPAMAASRVFEAAEAQWRAGSASKSGTRRSLALDAPDG